MTVYAVLEPDEAQEWRTTSRRIAEKTKIMHEELIATGLHQDLCYKLAVQYFYQALSAETPGQPIPDVRGMNKLVQRMLGLTKEDLDG